LIIIEPLNLSFIEYNMIIVFLSKGKLKYSAYNPFCRFSCSQDFLHWQSVLVGMRHLCPYNKLFVMCQNLSPQLM